MAKRVSENWEMICGQKFDFTCRLAYYMNNLEDRKAILFKNVIQSCPNDIGSCYLVYKNTLVRYDLSKVAIEALVENCKNIKSEYQEKICNSFNASKKKK